LWKTKQLLSDIGTVLEKILKSYIAIILLLPLPAIRLIVSLHRYEVTCWSKYSALNSKNSLYLHKTLLLYTIELSGTPTLKSGEEI